MKKALILAAGLLWPALAKADVNVYFGGGSEIEVNRYYYDDDPWYEECGRSGPVETRIEWQWHTHSGRRVLRFRTVSFNTIVRTWVYAPWEIKVRLCAPGCRIRHDHHYEHDCSYPYHPKYREVSRPKRLHKNGHHHSHSGPTRAYEYRRETRHDDDHHEHYYTRPSEEPRVVPSQPPVRRPAVRPVPGAHNATLQKSAPLAARTTPAPVASRQPVKVTTERVRVW